VNKKGECSGTTSSDMASVRTWSAVMNKVSESCIKFYKIN
jgi:hypothetical protein